MTAVMTIMPKETRAALLSAMHRAALLAAAAIIKGYRTRPRAEQKGPIDFVTEFDRESERVIRAELAPLGLPIVAEEEGGSAGQNGSPTFYVDPLDGTTNFLHGHPFFAVSIGLLADEVPLLGVVLAPALGLVWEGVAGHSATRNGEACAVSGTAELDAALLATGFPYDRRTSKENNFDAFLALKRVTRGVRRCGSASIDLCLVGDGTYDGYWERKLSPWDLVAGSAVVLGAGGQISDFSGGPARLRTGYVMASNGRIHDAIVRAVAAAESPPSDAAKI
jgi:myo-inositol-1(or 4)-monophosphatase